MRHSQRGFVMAGMMIAMMIVLVATGRHHGMMGMGHGDSHEHKPEPSQPKPDAPPAAGSSTAPTHLEGPPHTSSEGSRLILGATP